MNPRRLYRCRYDRKLAGVASGMAEYLGLDPTVVRILWILSVFVGGFSILLYLILALVIPLEPIEGAATAPAAPLPDGTAVADGDAGTATTAWTHAGHGQVTLQHEHRERGEGRLGLAFGVLLVIFGTIALIGPVLPGWVARAALGPAFLVALGIAFVVVALRSPTREA